MYSEKLKNQSIFFTNFLLTFWNYKYVKSMFSAPSEWLIFQKIFVSSGSIQNTLSRYTPP